METTASFKAKFLLCPQCTMRIPLFTLNKSNSLTLSCSCQSKTMEYSIRSYLEKVTFQYNLTTICTKDAPEELSYDYYSYKCTHCSLKHHLPLSRVYALLSQKVVIACTEHMEDFTHFNLEIKVNLCPKCKPFDRNNKDIRLIEERDLQEVKGFFDCFDRITDRNEKLVKHFIDEVNQESQSASLAVFNKLKKYKESIVALINSNERLNEDLIEFYKCFFYTALVLDEHPLYQLTHLYQSLKVNNTRLSIKDSNIDNAYTLLSTHLSNNFVLVQRKKYSFENMLRRNIATIWSMATIKGGQFATGSNDNTVAFYDDKTLTVNTVIYGFKKYVYLLLQVKDNQLAINTGDEAILIVDAIRFTFCAELNEHKSYVRCMTLLKSEMLASGSSDNTILIWSLTSYTCIKTLTGHSNAIWCLAPLSNGLLASGSGDKSVRVWDVNDCKCTMSFKEHSQCVYGLIELSTGDIASCSGDNTIIVYDLIAGKAKATLDEHMNSVRCLLLINKEQFASGSDDCLIKIWRVKDFRCMVSLNMCQTVYCMLKLKDDRIVSGAGFLVINV